MNWLLETLAEPSMIQAVAVISIVEALLLYSSPVLWQGIWALP